MRKRFLLMMVLALTMFFTGYGQASYVPAVSDDDNRTSTGTKEQVNLEIGEQITASSHDFNDPRFYNLEKYSQVQPGQSYEEVQVIMGDQGENMVDN